MSNNPTNYKSWKALETLSQEEINLNSLFASDAQRFEKFSIEENGIFFDYSKQRITGNILKNLIALLDESNFTQQRDAMFAGEKINTTENRAVLHTALRAPKDSEVLVDGENIIPEIHKTLARMETLSNHIRAGKYLGATGKPIKDIISIGIGGSDLGPQMIYNALNDGKHPVNIHFVSNIDAEDIERALQKCEPETTLFITISKSFGTQETLTNSLTARNWLVEKLSHKVDISNHFIAVTANIDTAQEFGIQTDNIYPMWSWVNGRFSLWSAVGLPLAIGLGFNQFKELLNGAHKIDNHFKTAPFEQNIPVLMALIGIWNRNFLKFSSHAILPYVHKLSLFPAYLQQLEMESNGKQTDLDGHKIKDYETGPVLFGEAGTNGQHSFYQMLHQGSDITACDFIGVIQADHTHQNHHNILNAHMLAQGQAMMQGKNNPDNQHRQFDGNRPSMALLLDKLDAEHLGMLIALYEHNVLVQGHIWNINSFDQYGVELGKIMANDILENHLSSLDTSTKGLYSRIYKKN